MIIRNLQYLKEIFLMNPIPIDRIPEPKNRRNTVAMISFC